MNVKRLISTLPLLLPLLIAGCSSTGPGPGSESRYSQRYDGAPDHKVDFDAIPDAVPRNEPLSRYGNPLTYVVRGKRYRRLTSRSGYVEQGIASWYGSKFHGHRTSSGETFDMYAVTAAHTTLPLPTYARVTNLDNGRSIIVKINDRGPFHDNRLIDLSYAAAGKLGILMNGTGRVEVVALEPPETDPAQTAAGPLKRPIHFVQVGAFKEQANAIDLERKLPPAFTGNTRISSAETDSGTVYRVQVGPFASREEALSLSRELIDHGISGTIIIDDRI